MINDWLRKILKRDVGSKDIAKKRLKFALICDKLEVSDDVLKNLHRDIVEVITLYFEIDQDAFKLDIRQNKDLSALIVNSPIISAKRRNFRPSSE